VGAGADATSPRRAHPTYIPRRAGRPLTEAEQATLLTRFDRVGPDRLGDVVLDFTPAELAAWLADPDAR
jgi:hypothetical protein